ncbi:MAG TPA: FxLYD domain-containing protein [Thermoanaerobaculia bacterium]|nr:FxLYD domain-containing protein [Thermoanaerobaculia bacterium]
MRRLLMIATAVFAVVAAVAGADEIWLKDGHSITTKKPVVTKGRNVLITTVDGVLVSVPLSEIDQAKTAEERARAAVPTPAPTPNLMRPMTPADAARQKSGRKAVVTLTDDAVAHGFGDEEAEKKPGDVDGRVEVANASATRGKDGYSFTGSVLNAGAAPVSAVSVTIEFVGKDGKTFSSTYANVAKDTLAPGEKSAFTASAALEGEAASFRYQARWQSVTPIRKADDKGAPGTGTGVKGDADAEPTPVPTPPPAPTLVPIPRPDVAPPTANAPVGNPANGAFLPSPDLPKTTAQPPST